MGTALITGVLTIVGVLIGTLLEPVKLLIASRARTRQTRAERCAQLIQAAETAKHGVVQLNAVDRAKRARTLTPVEEQVHAWIAEINKAKDDLRTTTALLRLYGPDELADEAARVLQADDEVFKHAKEPDDGEHQVDVVPPKLRAAAELVDAAIDEFARVARRFTR